ncbi:hypothetical protein BDC45DRAFT_495342 [Circinella umbellata]|nr:hypothetical protein BDC45DRAFT_495342 [Circinella umbellata]
MATTESLRKYLASYQLALIEDKEKGRSVIATAPLERGSIITTSQPLGTVPLKANRHEFCNYCFRKLGSATATGTAAVQYSNAPPPLQRCSRCKSAYFCDMACFKNAWLSYHQFVCRPPSNDNDKNDNLDDEDDSQLDLEMSERVALNVSRFMKRNQSKEQQQQEESQLEPNDEETVQVTMEAFASLMDHLDNHPRYLLDHYQFIAKTVKEKPYLCDTPLHEKDLVKFLGRFKCNNFAIYDEQLFTIGEGTYPIASLFNHSCRPNAAVLFDGSLLVIKAIDTIEPNEEITIAYVDIAHSRTERQKILREKYFFKCTCERCRDDNIIGRIDAMLGEEESDWDRAERLLNNSNHGDNKKQDISQQIMDLINNDWDLLEMTKTYNRRNGRIPDKSKPLSLQYYVHFFLPFLTPYLWSASNPAIQFVGTRSPPNSSSSSSANSSATLKHLTEFDDPPAHAALPYPGGSYREILESAIDQVSTYPPADIIPFRITTLSTCTRLFFDTMMEGQWRQATKLGMYILVQYSIIYPPYHPMLAQHLLLLAKSAWNSIIQNEIQGRKLETFQERGVRRWILLSKEAILYTFGKQSTMWREVLELEWIFIRDQNLKK